MKIDVIVPCFNEGPRVGKVLKALSESEFINKIIFVNDGGTDNSVEVAKRLPEIKIIDLKRNIGKGGAVGRAVKFVTTEAVLLCDADIRGFKKTHVRKLIKAHQHNKKALVIGVRTKGFHTLRHRAWDSHIPKFDGERILLTKDLEKIVESNNSAGFGLETWMNYYFKKNKKRVVWAALDGVQDGVFRRKGVKGIANEFAEIALTYKEVYKDSLKRSVKSSLDYLEV